MSVSAPYRFVPLSSLVVFPHWADQVSHDRPFSEGISGELNIQLHNTSALCVGGKQERSSEHQAGKVHFYRTPDNTLAIPGTSLKGMLRNVVEIASFSRFKQVEDQKLGVRDISEANNFYAKEMRNPSAGWLNFRNDKWTITPCSFIRIHQEQIIKHFNIPYEVWIEKNTTQLRYETDIKLCPEINFEEQSETHNNKVLANLLRHDGKKGHLVLTGQPGKGFKENGAKKHEFIFYDHQKEKEEPVDSDAMSDFMQTHESTKEWQFLFSQIAQLSLGIPVFWHEENGKVRSLGLTMMYKLAYKNSLHDAIKHTSPKHLNTQLPDMADLIFGYISDAESHSSVPDSLKGRVNILTAHLEREEPELKWSKNTILSSPKPKYYPLYIQQNSDTSFNQLMQSTAKLSGWKRYPVKAVDIQDPPKESNATAQVTLEQLIESRKFNGKIVFHNLRPVELGALIWALTFGNRTNLRHSLGMGKPYGLGQLQIEITNARLRRNNLLSCEEYSQVLEACVFSFQSYMNDIIRMVDPKKSEWVDTDELRALLEYATPSQNSAGLEYPESPASYSAVKKARYLPSIRKIHHIYAPTRSLKEFSVTPNNNLEELIPQLAAYKHQMSVQIAFEEAEAERLRIQELKQIEADKIRQQEEEDAKRIQRSKQAERNQLREQASDTEKCLIDLEDVLEKLKDGISKTTKANAVKKATSILEKNFSEFDDEQKQKFWTYCEKIHSIMNDKISTKLLNKRQ